MTLCLNVTGHIDESRFYHNMVLLMDPKQIFSVADVIRAIEAKALTEGLPPFRVGHLDVFVPSPHQIWRRVEDATKDITNGCFLYAYPLGHATVFSSRDPLPSTADQALPLVVHEAIFHSLDARGRGHLDFKDCIKLLPQHLNVVVELFNVADVNFDGVVDRQEFEAYCIEHPDKARKLSDALLHAGILQKREMWVISGRDPSKESSAHSDLLREMSALRSALTTFHANTTPTVAGRTHVLSPSPLRRVSPEVDSSSDGIDTLLRDSEDLVRRIELYEGQTGVRTPRGQRKVPKDPAEGDGGQRSRWDVL